MKRFAFLALALLCSAISLCATDLTITFQVETKSLLGGKTTSEIHYYTPRFQLVRKEFDKIDSLVDYEKATTYTIDHEKKTISMMRMDDAIAALEAMDQQAPNTMDKLMATMVGDVEEYSVETEGAEVIAGRKCTIHKITVGKMVMTLSADPSLSAPVPSASYAKMMKASAVAFAKAGPVATAYRRLYEEMGKIKGLPLKTQMSGYGGATNAIQEAIEIKEGQVPSALFALPAYPIEDLGQKLLKQRTR